jgi:hypothetical protein
MAVSCKEQIMYYAVYQHGSEPVALKADTLAAAMSEAGEMQTFYTGRVAIYDTPDLDYPQSALAERGRCEAPGRWWFDDWDIG